MELPADDRGRTIQMGFFTKASVKALRRDVAALSWDNVSHDPDITSGIFIAPAGRQALADLFVVYEAAAADVGEENALEVAVDAALSVERRYSGHGDPELTPLGRAQAVGAAARLAGMPAVTAVLTSPLRRARQTALRTK